MEYMKEELKEYKNIPKENIILFPHRLSSEKQVGIFKDLEKSLPEYKFVVCQEKQLTKHEYHTLLAKSKMVFSASLQETLGISMYEGVILKSIPLVPNRLSYAEMYPSFFKYDSNWTLNFENYVLYKSQLIDLIRTKMENYDRKEVQSYLQSLEQYLEVDYFNFNNFKYE